VCAESYQVVGALADGLGVFNDTKTIKALDNLSAQMLVHTDVLPFSVESSTLTVKLPGQALVKLVILSVMLRLFHSATCGTCATALASL
jgi:hypothetical protein